MESTVRRMKRTAGVNLSSLIWSFAAAALLILVTRAAAVEFTRSEDSLGNLDIYEVFQIESKIRRAQITSSKACQ